MLRPLGWALLMSTATWCHAGELPIQSEVGGGDGSMPAVHPSGTYSSFPVPLEGAGGMFAYLFVPDGVQLGRKYPLLYVFHGGGDPPRSRHRNLSAVSSKDFPVFVVAPQYDKEAKIGSARWSDEIIFKSWDWLLEKALKEHPIDPDRIYLQGFSNGAGAVGSWAIKKWKAEPGAFPFRALFFNSGAANSPRREDFAPVPYICIAGQDENNSFSRRFANMLLRFGHHVEYHEIPGMGHNVNERCRKIIRDTMMALGSPDDPALPHASGPLGTAIRLLKNAQWKDGLERLTVLEAKEPDASTRRALAEIRRVLQGWVPAQLKRLEARLADGLARRKVFEVETHAQLRALAAAFPEHSKALAARLADVERRHADEIQRRADFLAARLMEQPDREKARTMYESVAAAKESRTAKAAAYRLSWWTER